VSNDIRQTNVSYTKGKDATFDSLSCYRDKVYDVTLLSIESVRSYEKPSLFIHFLYATLGIMQMNQLPRKGKGCYFKGEIA
jgi:hypothetical protein